MISRYFQPVEEMGGKFDRGMVLFEFEALREPERTRFPKIGEFVRSRCEMNEVPPPQMLWRGLFWPDLYIANQLGAVSQEMHADFPKVDWKESGVPKSAWDEDVSVERASRIRHGREFHEAFIEPMCRKIAGLSTEAICAKYHRSIWLPLYWPQTLRARESIPTRFHYPRSGFAFAALDGLPLSDGVRSPGFGSVELNLGFLVARPRREFSVLFVLDDSPIYRITDMDACAGIAAEYHRYVVESRGPANVMRSMLEWGLCCEYRSLAFGTARLQLPTIENVKNGWTPPPHLNDQLWDVMNAP